MNKWAAYLGVACLAGFVSITVLAAVQGPANTPLRQWTSECFSTFDGMVAGLSRLDVNRQDAAKVVVINSSRNIGGIFGSPYCLVYPK